MDNNRIHYLDFLRGFSAAGIMVYHYIVWSQGDLSADSLLQRVGLYGVSIFYILSGLTLSHVYSNKITSSASTIWPFYIKRIFRIFPLMWLITGCHILILNPTINWLDVILNLSGLFGIFNWNGGIATGIWSIGNEVVFYLFFPFLIILSNRTKIGFYAAGLIIFLIYVYFAFFEISIFQHLGDLWHVYTNPLNQLLFFWGGCYLGIYLNRISINQIVNLIALSILLISFVFLPVSENPVNLVYGFNRVLLGLICWGICFCFYKTTFLIPALIAKPFVRLGEVSYSVYLIHPIVWYSFRKMVLYYPKYFNIENDLFKIPILIIVTLVLSYFMYSTLEKYFIKKGAILVAMLKQKHSIES